MPDESVSLVDDARLDGALINAVSGLGTSKDKSAYTAIIQQPYLSQSELEALYMDPIPRRVVDLIADECVREHPTIQLGGDTTDTKVISSLEMLLGDMRFFHKLVEVIKLQRLYGGAVLLILVDDGQNHDKPINEKRIRAVRGVVPLSRYQIHPDGTTSIWNYENPDYYRISTSKPVPLQGQETNLGMTYELVHRSRVLRFDGMYLPWDLRQRNNGWGLSVLQLLWQSYKNYGSCVQALGNMLLESDLFVHTLPGLAQKVAAGQESALKRRLEANTLARSLYGGMVIDQGEEVAFINRNLTGTDGVMDRITMDLQAATGIPRTLLMGESPGGLGKEGRYEERAWAQLVGNWQSSHIEKPFRELCRLIFLSQEGPTKGREPQEWQVVFPPIFSRTEEEEVALRVQMAQADNTYVQMGAVAAKEIRESRFGGTDYSIEVVLDESLDPSQQPQPGMVPGQQGMPGADPNAQTPPGTDPIQPDQPAGNDPNAGGDTAPDLTQMSDEEFNRYLAELGMKMDAADPVELIRVDGLTVAVTQRTSGRTPGHGYLVDRYGHPARNGYDRVVLGGSDSTKLYKAVRTDEAGRPTEAALLVGFGNLRGARSAAQATLQGCTGVELLSELDRAILRGTI
jgi:phage-related protein (TIGR01555 family)